MILTIKATIVSLALAVAGFFGYQSQYGGDLRVLEVRQGGTGTSTVPASDQILIGGSNSRYDVKTLTAGSNVTIDTSGGTVVISSSGGGGGGSGESVFSRNSTTNLIYHPTTTDSVAFGVTATSSGGTAPTLYIDNSNGRIGIGTSSPATKLHIQGSASSVQYTITNQQTGGYSGFRLQGDNLGSDWEGLTGSTDCGTTKSSFCFYNNKAVDGGSAGTKVTIATTGFVGIGRTDPRVLLDLVGGASSDQIRLGQNSVNYYQIGRNTTTGFLDFNGNQTGFVGYTFSSGNVGIGSSTPIAKLSVEGNLHLAGSSQDISWRTGEALQIGEYDGTTFTERMRILNNGNVGISSTSPGARLAVNGDSSTGRVFGFIGADRGWSIGQGGTTGAVGSFQVRDEFRGATALLISQGGLVGIGTTTPGDSLSVVGNSSPAIAIFDNSVATVGRGGKLKLQHTNSNGSAVSYASINAFAQSGTPGGEAGDLVFNTMRTGVETEAVRIKASGNVGIGTTTPNWNLQVTSNTPYIAITDTDAGTNKKHWLLSNIGGTFAIGTSSDALNGTSSYLTINESGGVGIGETVTGNTKLFVNGNTRVAGNIYGRAGSTFLIANENGASTVLAGGSVSNSYLELRGSGGNIANDYIKFTGGNNGATEIARMLGNGNVGIGTTTPVWPLTVLSSTGGQFALSEGAGFPLAIQRWKGGQFTISSTTVAGTATTTPAGLTLDMGAGVFPGLEIGTTTSATTTIQMGKIQFDGYTNSGGRVCAYIVGTSWVISSGACPAQ